MAERTKSDEDLKQDAIARLAESRGELWDEFQWARHKLSPTHAASDLLRDHGTMALLVTFSAGLVLPFLVGGKAKSERVVEEDTKRLLSPYAPAPPPRRKEKPLLAALLGMAVRAALPQLAKTVSTAVMQHLPNFQQQRNGQTQTRAQAQAQAARAELMV